MSLVAVITAQEEMLLREAVARSQPALSSLVDELVADVRRLTADEGNALRDAVGPNSSAAVSPKTGSQMIAVLPSRI
jgi:hypothetical protein